MATTSQGKPGIADCPKCQQHTANETDGQWGCSNGCDLAGHHQCPKCGKLHSQVSEYCSEACAQ